METVSPAGSPGHLDSGGQPEHRGPARRSGRLDSLTRNSAIQTARTFHAFIVASTCIVLLGALVVTRSTGAVTTSLGALDGVALVTGLSSLAIASLVRQRLPSGASVGSVEAWWQEHLGRAVLIWSVFEMPAVVGAITLFSTRHLPGFLALGVVALAGLLTARPSRLYRA